MNSDEMFEKGCFSPEWATDDNDLPISRVYLKHNKDLQTLLQELNTINDNIQQIQARQWHLAEMMKFHEHQIANE